MYKKNNSSLVLKTIFKITFFEHIAINISFPVLTFLCFDAHSVLFSHATMETRAFWYGLLNALPHFMAMITAPLLSILSDYTGRKKILSICVMGIVLWYGLMLLGIIYQLLFLLFLGVLCAGFCARTEPIALAIVADHSHGEQKLITMGWLQCVIALGAFLGSLLGGLLLQSSNYRYPFGIGILSAIFAFGLLSFQFREQREDSTIKFSVEFFSKKIWTSQIISISLLLLLTQVSWRLYYQFIPPFLKLNLYYSPTEVGLFTAMIGFWLSIASFWGIDFLRRYFSRLQMLIYAAIAMAIGMIFIIIASLIPVKILLEILTWLSAVFMSIGDVIIYIILTTLYSEAVSEKDQGKIMGLNFFIVSIVWALTGLLGGWLVAVNSKLPLWIAAVPLFILGIIFCLSNSLLSPFLQRKFQKTNALIKSVLEIL